jgi:hypothetical protein
MDEYDEWQGIIMIEVPIALRATSGRPKHTDPEEQGVWLAGAVRTALEGVEGVVDSGLRHIFSDSLDVSIGDTRMVGHEERRWLDWDDFPRDAYENRPSAKAIRTTAPTFEAAFAVSSM